MVEEVHRLRPTRRPRERAVGKAFVRQSPPETDCPAAANQPTPARRPLYCSQVDQKASANTKRLKNKRGQRTIFRHGLQILLKDSRRLIELISNQKVEILALCQLPSDTTTTSHKPLPHGSTPKCAYST
jgi:hypothetical protein